MRTRLTALLLLGVCCGPLCQSQVQAEPIRVFVPGKPWEVAIELRGFEPWTMLRPKTILGGTTTNGMIITILVEEEKPPVTPRQAMEKYWRHGPPGQATIEFTNEHLIVVSGKDSPPPLGQPFNGYAVKENVSFDIHVSADLSQTTREQVLNAIRSVRIEPSAEAAAMIKLEADLKAAKKPAQRKELLLGFTTRYKSNSWAFVRLAEVCYGLDQRAEAETAYLQALENHKTQPMVNPFNLWLCYDGLGLIYGMSQRYKLASTYFEKGYECAQEMGSDERLADSAYNRACVGAETGDLKSCFKYLGEAIKLNPDKKASAKTDSSFARIRKQAEFIKLVGK